MFTVRNIYLGNLYTEVFFSKFVHLNFNMLVLFAKQWWQSVTEVCMELCFLDKQNSSVHYRMTLSL